MSLVDAKCGKRDCFRIYWKCENARQLRVIRNAHIKGAKLWARLVGDATSYLVDGVPFYPWQENTVQGPLPKQRETHGLSRPIKLDETRPEDGACPNRSIAREIFRYFGVARQSRAWAKWVLLHISAGQNNNEPRGINLPEEEGGGEGERKRKEEGITRRRMIITEIQYARN